MYGSDGARPEYQTPEVEGRFKGGWRMPPRAKYIGPGSAMRCFVAVCPKAQQNPSQFLPKDKLIGQLNGFKSAACKLGVGLDFGDLLPGPRNDNPANFDKVLLLSDVASVEEIEREFRRVGGNTQPGTDMLLAIMPDQNNNTWQHPIRPTLKGWCAREGIALQCVKVGKFGNPGVTDKGYFGNL